MKIKIKILILTSSPLNLHFQRNVIAASEYAKLLLANYLWSLQRLCCTNVWELHRRTTPVSISKLCFTCSTRSKTNKSSAALAIEASLCKFV